MKLVDADRLRRADADPTLLLLLPTTPASLARTLNQGIRKILSNLEVMKKLSSCPAAIHIATQDPNQLKVAGRSGEVMRDGLQGGQALGNRRSRSSALEHCTATSS